MSKVIIVGGGIAGLTSAAILARRGLTVEVFEQAARIGGRARTLDEGGFKLNLGAHALYRGGAGFRILRGLGIEPRGRTPAVNGFAYCGGALSPLPVTLPALLRTRLLSSAGKWELARVVPRLIGAGEAEHARGLTLRAYLDTRIADASLRGFLAMLFRVSTYANAPELQSASAALDAIRMALRANVLYLDDGWQQIVDALRSAAKDAGAQVATRAMVTRVESGRVLCADGSEHRAEAVIVAAPPEAAGRVLGRAFATQEIRAACLDVGLERLPDRQHTVAFGIDTPVYLSVHSAIARLAPPGGAVVHLLHYLAPGERVEASQLEALLDLAQPGWRDVVRVRRFSPQLIVSHGMQTLTPRTPGILSDLEGVFLAGDWIGERGQLADASFASAEEAADRICAMLHKEALAA